MGHIVEILHILFFFTPHKIMKSYSETADITSNLGSDLEFSDQSPSNANH